MKRNNTLGFYKTKEVLLIILLALGIRLSFFVLLKPWNSEVVNKKILVHDSIEYNDIALNFLSDHSFVNCGSFRTPVYPLFISSCYLIAGKTIWFVLLVQIAISILTLLVVYKLVLEFFSRKVALITILLLSLDYHQAESVVTLLTEILFSFILVLSIYFLAVGFRRKQTSLYMAISGSLLGLATLTRPITILFPAAAIAFIITYNFLSNKNAGSKIIIKSSAIFSFYYILSFFLFISPWIYRNYSMYKEPSLSSITGYNLLFYNVALTEAARTGNSLESTQDYFKRQVYNLGADTTDFYSFKNSKIDSRIAIKYIKNNFIPVCKTQLIGMVNLFYSFDKFSRIGKLSGLARYRMTGFLIYYGILYLLSIGGIALLIKNKNYIYILFLLLIFYFDVITGAVGDQRYAVPIMPFVYIFCATGILFLYNKKKEFSTLLHLKLM